MRTTLVIACILARLVVALVQPTQRTFRVQHDFGLGEDQEISWAASASVPLTEEPSLTIKTRSTRLSKPVSVDLVQQARHASMHDGLSMALEWTEVVTSGPDIEDRHTLSQLARMAGDAYSLPGEKRWYELDPAWNHSFPFGWEDAADGFRGHVFRSSDNATTILSIKGTTLNGPTSKKDKYNDNLLFSCCCARVDVRWALHTVCGCYAGHNKCDATCLSDAMIEDSLFYSTGVSLVTQLLLMYPDDDIWLVGHSLGGALAALLGTTFGLPAVAFEAPGEKAASRHLHLPVPKHIMDAAPVTHVYHNADPIAMGTCKGALSPCSQAGYALETRCHLGKSIVYDTVGAMGWRPDVTHHPIRTVITKVIEDEREWEDGRQVPVARREEDCFDCTKWEYDDFGKSLY